MELPIRQEDPSFGAVSKMLIDSNNAVLAWLMCDEATADFIVKSVNNHNRLVEILGSILNLGELDMYGEAELADNPGHPISAARTLLKELEG